ncbi:MAG: S8 family serine peptidase [Bacteroidota bacterium]
MKIIYPFFLFICFSSLAHGQAQLRGWHLSDPAKTSYYGISLKETYDLINEKKLKSVPVIVAILDDGIDTSHEDLQSALWINSKEIAGNGVDEDKNGFVDDLHGWNFLGNAAGVNVGSNSSEWIRVYWRYKAMYEGKTIDTTSMSRAQKFEYAQWVKSRAGVVGKGMKQSELDNIQQYLRNALYCDSLLRKHFPSGEYTQKQLEDFKPATSHEKEVRKFFLEVFAQFNAPDISNRLALDELTTYVVGQVRVASGDKVPPEDNRRDITSDDETLWDTKTYGNNDVSNGELMHGSHLAGIIAASRKNGIGMQGIAENVQVMMVRTSAEGDEYDKDIAKGIRYAVDNGAKVINMSFGKSLSPDKTFIDDAVKYALQKDVLIVQAAGNSRRDIDGFDNYPNPRYLFTDSLAPNWITVGASDTLGHPASFSNYGKNLVDLFAPGVAIYSTIPKGNKYMAWDGTSMAAPVVSGIAAMLRSYFPQLSAVEIKSILLGSVTLPKSPVGKGATAAERNLDQLSKTGGIVNALAAFQAALKRRSGP